MSEPTDSKIFLALLSRPSCYHAQPVEEPTAANSVRTARTHARAAQVTFEAQLTKRTPGITQVRTNLGELQPTDGRVVDARDDRHKSAEVVELLQELGDFQNMRKYLDTIL